MSRQLKPWFRKERRSGIVLTLLDRNGSVVRDPALAQGPYSIRIDNQGVDSAGKVNLINRSESYYNAKGQLVRSVSGIGPEHSGVETRNEYDSRGRQILQIGAPVATTNSSEPLRLVSKTNYDALGRAFQSVTNIAGKYEGGHLVQDISNQLVTTQLYDSLGRAYKTVYADGSSTSVEFDAFGQVTAEIDQLGNRKQMEYDSNGRLVSVVDN